MPIPTNDALINALDVLKGAITETHTDVKGYIDHYVTTLQAEYKNADEALKTEVLASIDVNSEALKSLKDALDLLDGTQDGEANAKDLLAGVLAKSGANETAIGEVATAFGDFVVNTYQPKVDELTAKIGNNADAIVQLKGAVETAIASGLAGLEAVAGRVTALEGATVKFESLWETLISQLQVISDGIKNSSKTAFTVPAV